MKRDHDPARNRWDIQLRELGAPLDPSEVDRATIQILNCLRMQAGEGAPPFDILDGVVSQKPPARWPRVAAAVAAVVLVVAAGIAHRFLVSPPLFAVVEAVDGRLEAAGAGVHRRLGPGDRVPAGQTVETGESGGAVLSLPDGSRIELDAGVALRVESADDGVRVALQSGSVIVSAARQLGSTLYVQTEDCLVSVVGTVFAVHAEAGGSRVSVVQGEVQVEANASLQTLRPGQQVATTSAVARIPMEEELSWSRNAAAHLALLGESAVLFIPVPPTPQAEGVHGIVHRIGSGDGIPGATVTLCPDGATAPSESVGLPSLPSRESIAEIRILNAGDGSNVTVTDKQGVTTLLRSAIKQDCINPTSVQTDVDGRFSFGLPPPGSYVVRASREGYWGQALDDGRFADDSTVTVLVGPQPSSEILLGLMEGVTITGRVFDERGQPLPAALVQASTPADSPRGPMLRATGMQRPTDDRGEYRLFGLPPGEYYVSVSPKPLSAVERASASSLAEVRMFYPNAMTPATATSLTLKAGAEFSRADITVRRPALAKVSGQVLSSVPGDTTISLMLASRDLQHEAAAIRPLAPIALTQSRGAFTFQDVLPGSYDLIATSTGNGPGCESTVGRLPENEQDLASYLRALAARSLQVGPAGRAIVRTTCSAVASVEVRDRDVEGVTIALHRSIDVHGRITVNGRASAEGIKVRLVTREGTRRLGFATATETADGAGVFVISGVPAGRFDVEVQFPESLNGAYISEARAGGAVIRSGLTVGSEAVSLDISIGMNGGTASGLVVDENQAPIARAQVFLLAANGVGAAMPRRAAADSAGRFAFDGLAPGEYRVLAIRGETAPQWNESWRLRFGSYTQAVSVRQGTVVSNLRISALAWP